MPRLGVQKMRLRVVNVWRGMVRQLNRRQFVT